MNIKKLLTVDDYQEAWRMQDLGEGWIAYRKDVDFYCPPDVIGFDRERMDGGVGGLSDTETILSPFLIEIQSKTNKQDLSDVYEYAKKTGIQVTGKSATLPLSPMTKDMIDHEQYLLEDPEAGHLWLQLREKARMSYAVLVYSLHRQKWAKNWVQMINKVLLKLEKQGLGLSQLRALGRIDLLSIERAREYKTMATHVPKRLHHPLKRLEQVTAEDSAVSSAARAKLEEQHLEYKSFLEEYKRRRKLRFETLAEYHFQAIAGKFKGLLKEPRGRPSLTNLSKRVVKAVFVELADELIQTYGMSLMKSTLIAGQISSLLFPDERVTKKAKPFDSTFGKLALNEYKYAKKSLP